MFQTKIYLIHKRISVNGAKFKTVAKLNWFVGAPHLVLPKAPDDLKTALHTLTVMKTLIVPQYSQNEFDSDEPQ